jgi:hypothetical protein
MATSHGGRSGQGGLAYSPWFECKNKKNKNKNGNQ